MGASEWAAARRDAADLGAHDDLETAAALYCQRYPNHPPNEFSYTRSQRRRFVARAFGSGDGWAARLLMLCPAPVHYTLDARSLGLDLEDADPTRLYDPSTVARWKVAIFVVFGKHPHHWKLEAASSVHAHVISDASACPQSVRLGSRRAKPCLDYYETAVAYHGKTATPYTWQHLATFWKARHDLPRLPRLSGTSGISRTPPKETTKGTP